MKKILLTMSVGPERRLMFCWGKARMEGNRDEVFSLGRKRPEGKNHFFQGVAGVSDMGHHCC